MMRGGEISAHSHGKGPRGPHQRPWQALGDHTPVDEDRQGRESWDAKAYQYRGHDADGGPQGKVLALITGLVHV